MINTLSYSVTFAKTGRTLSASLSFETGLTAITGPNEAGKSMVIEIMRWCLFGSDALRGTADDYASITGDLTFTARGSTYKIHRTLKGGRIHKGDELLCSGTRPVTSKVLEILGFDLEVFDISCAANQGDIEKLAAMRPTDRKRMVDRVIGSDRIEELAKWCGDEALLIGREVTALERGLNEPQAPERPIGYVPAVDLARSIERLRADQRRLHELYGWLRTKPAEPVAPVAPSCDVPLESLQKAEDLLGLHVYDFNRLVVEEAWQQYQAWQERVEFDDRHPRPSLTQHELDVEVERLTLSNEQARLLKSPTIECPCGKPFTTADGRLAEIAARLLELPHHPARVENLQIEQKRIRDWASEGTLSEWECVKDAIPADRPDIDKHALHKANQPGSIRADDLTTALSHLGVPLSTLRDVREAIQSVQAYNAQLTAYEPQRAAYEAWGAKAAEIVTEVQILETTLGDLPGYETQLAQAQAYEAAQARHETDLVAYQVRVAELDEKRLQRTSWSEGKVGFNSLREKIKTYLVPSLSRAASGLLSQMTGGARNSIVVDEEFDVTVDGQRISTLSGSGKACANLALRIGLGQVLTNNVLSIFIGDEIDASMDAERAGNIQSSLAMISSRISQIIIVTHKIPQADHVIELGSLISGQSVHQGAIS